MRSTVDGLVLAATDLSSFLACPHRSALDLAVAVGKLGAPPSLLDEHTRLLRERGQAHEHAYVQHLVSEGLAVVEVPQDETPYSRVKATIEAFQSGVDVVYQGAFAGDGWVGYADILRRVPTPAGSHSAFGDFHYEPYDTKLARTAKPAAVLQLAWYAGEIGATEPLESHSTLGPTDTTPGSGGGPSQGPTTRTSTPSLRVFRGLRLPTPSINRITSPTRSSRS